MVSESQQKTSERLDWFAAKYTYLLRGGDLSEKRENELRNELLMEFYPIGKSVARRVWSRLPSGRVELLDLVQEGMIGLSRSLPNFDVSKGHFLGWGITRFNGSLFDYLRESDQIPRTVRIAEKKIEKYRVEFYQENNRFPNELELEGFWRGLGPWSRDSYSQFKKRLEQFRSENFQDTLLNLGSEDEKLVYLSEFIESPKSELEWSLQREEDRESFEAWISKVFTKDSREWRVLDLYYQHNFSMSEIGKIFGFSESRACQIHSSALKKLRERKELLALLIP